MARTRSVPPLRVVPLTLLAALLTLTPGCGRRDAPLPDHLAEMAMTAERSGEEARKAVDMLHGKGVAPGRSAIREYEGHGSSAVLYVSWYGDDAEARTVLGRMVRRIREGSPPFSGAEDMTVRDQAVVACRGLGQRHLVFARGRGVYWLSADPAVADTAADDLVRSLIR